jgi:hypothetical protein
MPIAAKYLGSSKRYREIMKANPEIFQMEVMDYLPLTALTANQKLEPGSCIRIPLPPNNHCHPPKWNRYWRYDLILDYMYRQMKSNSQGKFPWHWSGIPFGIWPYTNLWLLEMFAMKVRQGGPWDHKPKLDRLVGHSTSDPVFYTPIRGAERAGHWRLRYDVWSNIHYGYVGRAYGIPRDILWYGQRYLGGHTDEADNMSVSIGIKLRDRFGSGLTKAQLQDAVADNMIWYVRSSSERDIVVRSGRLP